MQQRPTAVGLAAGAVAAVEPVEEDVKDFVVGVCPDSEAVAELEVGGLEAADSAVAVLVAETVAVAAGLESVVLVVGFVGSELEMDGAPAFHLPPEDLQLPAYSKEVVQEGEELLFARGRRLADSQLGDAADAAAASYVDAPCAAGP